MSSLDKTGKEVPHIAGKEMYRVMEVEDQPHIAGPLYIEQGEDNTIIAEGIHDLKIARMIRDALNTTKVEDNTAKIYIHHASAAVKDQALKVCVASAPSTHDWGEGDVFIDMDTVRDRMPKEDDASASLCAVIILRSVIEMAAQADAQYIHIY